MLLSLVLVLALIIQFALPAMADMIVCEDDAGFLPTTVTTSSTTETTLYTYTVPSNCTATYVQVSAISTNDGYTAYLNIYINGTKTYSGSTAFINICIGGSLNGPTGTIVKVTGYVSNSSDTLTAYGNSGVISSTSSILEVTYDFANETTATNAYNEATTAATDAAAAQTAATSASTAANYIENNMLSTSGGIVQDSSGTVLQAARAAQTAANTAATNSSTAAANAQTAASNTTYNSQSAAYWAYQASQSASAAPVITSISGVNGATCTTGSSYSANVTISPGSNISYIGAISGPGGSPSFGYSGNTLTISNMTVSGAYTVNVTATYTPDGKTCQGSFIFFKI